MNNEAQLRESYRTWRDRQSFPVTITNQTDLWLWKCFAAGWQAAEAQLAKEIAGDSDEQS